MGPIEKDLAIKTRREGEPLPERIAKAPRLYMGLEFYLDAFHDLDGERNHAFGYQRIPRSHIVDYAVEKGLSREGMADLIFLIRRIDEAHIERLKELEKRGGASRSN